MTMTNTDATSISPHTKIPASNVGSAAKETPNHVHQPTSVSGKIPPKRPNHNNMEGPTNVPSPNKRTKVETTHDAGMVVTPTSNTVAEDAVVVLASNEKSSTSSKESSLDLATTLGYKGGDRIEVQWEIQFDEEDDENVETIQEDTTTTTTTVWWKATLLEHDGRTTDSVAIRSLLYDARPDLGFPEMSKEDVVFMGHDLLVSPHDESVQLKYKREGLTEEENQLVVCSDDQLDEQLNQIVMGTLQRNQHVWKVMPAAAQAVIAEKMQTMKERMKEKLRALGPQVVITSETIRQLIAQSF
jgi:hypothetical protein